MVTFMAVNWIGVVVAAIASMVLGAIWYSPSVFGKQWMKLAKVSDKQMKEGGGMAYAKGFIMALVTAFVFAQFVENMAVETMMDGIMIGVWAWLGFIATTLMNAVIYEGRPKGLYGINVTYQLVNLVVMGAILATWMVS